MDEVERLYRLYFPSVYSVCFLYMRNQTDACDMVQETFLRLMQSSFTYISDEKAKSWLLVTASNCCRTQLGKWWRRKRVKYDEAMLELKRREPEHLILQMIGQLDEALRLTVYLHYFEGYSSQEIGEMLQISASAVRSRLAKARARLKAEFADEKPEAFW